MPEPAETVPAETVPDRGWVVILPVKRLASAKTRLDRADRTAVALAMAADTARAAAACRLVHAVLVVSDEAAVAPALGDLARVVADRPDAGLNPALAHGAAEARARWPDLGLAALAADLPALRPDELTVALTAAAEHTRGVLADADGSGSVLLTASAGTDLDPAFGPDSRRAHVDNGAVDLTDRLGVAVASVRRDVDTLADLQDASALGLGPKTRGLLDEPTPDVQATVRSWSAETRSGSAVTDRGAELELTPEARLVGSLRLLRAGHRVRLSLADGKVRTIGLLTEF